jgi:KDO2-lipid IV(A) lauroyltransferase
MLVGACLRPAFITATAATATSEDVRMVYYLSRLANWLSGKAPRRLRLNVAGAVTVLVYYAWISKRRNTIANYAQILGASPRDPRVRRLARHSWRDFGRYISDFFYLPNATTAQILARMQDVTPAPGSFALVDEARARGKGVLLVSAHYGAYDVAGVLVATHTPVHLLIEPLPDPRMNKLWQEQRGQFGLGVISIEKTPRQILRVLQQNGTVAVAIDRPMPPGEGVPITFFGRRCWVPGGIAAIALKSGAAIVPGFCYYDERFSDTYYLRGSPVIFPEHTGDKQADTIALTQRMYDALEEMIRRRPEQWAMFRRFWPIHDDVSIAAEATPAAIAVSGAEV